LCRYGAETKANPDGTMTVAGSAAVSVKVENPGFTTSSSAGGVAGKDGKRRSLLSADGSGRTATALVDAAGAAIVTGALTDATGTQQDSFGNDVSTATKTYEAVFGGDALVDLLHVQDRSYVSSIQNIETSGGNGASLSLGITGHDFQDIHYRRDAEGALRRVADSAGATYDLAVHTLLLHTSNARFPEILVASVEPLSEAEEAKTPAVNMSMPLTAGASVSDLLDALYAADDAGGAGSSGARRLLWGCNVWCQLNNLRNSANNAWNHVNAWKSQAQRSINDSKSQLSRFSELIGDSLQKVNAAMTDVKEMPQDLMDKVRAKVDPIKQLSGCDIIGKMTDSINGYLAQKPMCLSPGCSGSHLNSGALETLHEDDEWKVEGKTDLTACFQLYDLELDCDGLDQAMQEFWSNNELDSSINDINDAIANNQRIKDLKSNIEYLKNKLSGWSGKRKLLSDDHARALLAEVTAEAYAAVDTGALADKLHAATAKDVGERLAAFMKRRKVLENRGRSSKSSACAREPPWTSGRTWSWRRARRARSTATSPRSSGRSASTRWCPSREPWAWSRWRWRRRWR
jgi:hypothetical protein